MHISRRRTDTWTPTTNMDKMAKKYWTLIVFLGRWRTYGAGQGSYLQWWWLGLLSSPGSGQRRCGGKALLHFWQTLVCSSAEENRAVPHETQDLVVFLFVFFVTVKPCLCYPWKFSADRNGWRCDPKLDFEGTLGCSMEFGVFYQKLLRQVTAHQQSYLLKYWVFDPQSGTCSWGNSVSTNRPRFLLYTHLGSH